MALPGVWTEAVHVESGDVGPRGRLALPALCGRLQDAAGRHAAALGVSIETLRERRLTWVMARLQLRIDRLPASGSTVDLLTWPSRVRGFTVHRDFELGVGGERAARATSTWFVIGLDERRPVRVPPFVHELPCGERPAALEHHLAALPRLERADHERRFALAAADFDDNDHVNHVRYVEWALDTLPAEFRSSHAPLELDIDFRAEITGGGEVVSLAERRTGDGGVVVVGRLTHAGQDGEAARWRSRWRAEAAEGAAG